MKTKIITAIALATVILSSGLYAAEKYPHQNEIEARKASMQVNKFHLVLLSAMVRGTREYDAAIAEAAAKNMYASTQMNNIAMWPKGSDNSSAELKPHTDALLVGWTESDKLMEKHKAWQDAAANLAANAGKGKDALKSVIGAVGKSCKGCHDDFKQQK